MDTTAASTGAVTRLQTALRLEQRLLQVLEWFDQAGVPAIALKGSAAAHLDRQDPAERTFGDVDVLVADDRLDVAVGVLRGRGYSTTPPARQSSTDRRFLKSVTLTSPDAIEIDVHRTLAPGPFGFTIDLDDLFASTTTVELAGRSVPALDDECRFLHACYHGALSRAFAHESLRDAAVLLSSPGLDHDRVAFLAHRWSGEPVVTRAIHLLRTHLDVTAVNATTAAFEDRPLSTVERRAMAAYTTTRPSYLRQAVASLPYLDRWRDRAALVVGSFLPSQEYLDAHGLLAWFSYVARWVVRAGGRLVSRRRSSPR